MCRYAALAILLASMFAPGVAAAQNTCALPEPGPSEIQISLVTVSPGAKVFSVFGHVSVWVRDGRSNSEWIYNFGIVRKSPDRLGQFLRGELNFFIGKRSFGSMMDLYTREDRTIHVQRLDLEARESFAMLMLLEEEVAAGDYQYHWKDDNCATRVRDIIDAVSEGQFAEQNQDGTGATLRDEVLRHLSASAPLWFGWHYAVSGTVDHEITHWDAMFLPDRLMQRVGDARIVRNEAARPLVLEECELHRGTHHWAPMEPPSWVGQLFGIGLAIAALLLGLGLAAESGHKRLARFSRFGLGGLVALIGVLGGVLGSLSVYLWTVSIYSGFHRNENLFQASPLTFALVFCAIAVIRNRWHKAAFYVAAGLLGCSVLGVALGLLPPFVQQNGALVALWLPILASNALVMFRLRGISS